MKEEGGDDAGGYVRATRRKEDSRGRRAARRGCVLVLQRGTGSRYIGEEAGKRRAALLCAAAEAFVPARKRESHIIFRNRKADPPARRRRVGVPSEPLIKDSDNNSRLRPITIIRYD